MTVAFRSRPVVVDMAPVRDEPRLVGEWVEPASLAEAHDMRAELTERLLVLQTQVATNDPALMNGGEGLDPRAFAEWKRRAKLCLAHMHARMARLNGWIKVRTIAAANDEQVRQLREQRRGAWRLLLRCAEHVPDDLAEEIAATVPEGFAEREDGGGA